MLTERYSTEQIVSKLRPAEVELSRGRHVPQMCKQLGLSEQTSDRWRKEYGGLRLDQAKRGPTPPRPGVIWCWTGRSSTRSRKPRS